MISKNSVSKCSGELTKNDGDNDGLNVLCAGFIGVSRKIGDIQAQGGIVTQYSIEICKRVSD